MTGEIVSPIQHEDWYIALVDELKTLVTEGEFNARWTLVETYHMLGNRILEENDNFDRSKIYGEALVKQIAVSLQKSERTLYNAIAFAKKYPDLSMLPGGKNVSWSKICKQLLPAKTEDEKPAPIVVDPQMLKDIVQLNMEYLLEYAEPTEKGYKFFIPREKIQSYYERGKVL